jgi:RNA recognition motif-containing protein
MGSPRQSKRTPLTVRDVCAEDGKAPPVIVPPRQTTLYVGKIASSINDDLIKQLLDACGSVKSWKRMEDPDTKALKPFGFCEYEEADGVVRALNLLQNLSVGGQVSSFAVLSLQNLWPVLARARCRYARAYVHAW